MAGIGLVVAHDADHAGAAPGGDLCRGLADLAVDAEDQHGFPGAGQAGAVQSLPGGDEGHADAGGILGIDSGGNGNDGIGFDDHVAGMRAVLADAEVTGRPEHELADQGLRSGDDSAGVVATRRAREDGVGHEACRRLDVRRIDGSGGDLDHHLVRRRRAQQMFFDRQPDRVEGRHLLMEAQAAGDDPLSVRTLDEKRHGLDPERD